MIVIVMGLPGSGKSYFASRFAKLIDADYVNSDRVRQHIFSVRSYSEKEKSSIYDEMLKRMRQALRENKDLVLDATFYKNDIRKRFVEEARDTGEMVFLEIVAEEAVIKERLKNKRVDSEADFEVYKLIKQQWDPFQGHRLILLSTPYNIDNMLHQALDYLKLKNDKPAYC